jgi:hypothetical protein
MGKRFVTRSRREWEALLQPDTEDATQVQASASAWLRSRLEGYVQSTPDAPITLAVPDRFLELLGDVREEIAAEASDGKRVPKRRERPVG